MAEARRNPQFHRCPPPCHGKDCLEYRCDHTMTSPDAARRHETSPESRPKPGRSDA